MADAFYRPQPLSAHPPYAHPAHPHHQPMHHQPSFLPHQQAPGVAKRSPSDYEIIVRQEPKQARMCGIGNKADRRPIDPPPIVELRIRNRPQTGSGSRQYSTHPNGSPTSSHEDSPPPPPNFNNLQPSPYFFMFAALVSPHGDDEMHLLKDGKTRATVGSVVSSLYTLKDPERGGDTGFFVFPDLSVRSEGSYRLKLSLFEVVGSYVHYCKCVYSQPFYVYTAKKFPGMEESTSLSQHLSEQGIKIRIRRDMRRKSIAAPVREATNAEEDDDDDQVEVAPPPPAASRSGSKRKGSASKSSKTAGGGSTTPGTGGRTAKRQKTGGEPTLEQPPAIPPFPSFGEPAVYRPHDDLPAPSIPGGVPIDVPFHPDMKVREDAESLPLPGSGAAREPVTGTSAGTGASNSGYGSGAFPPAWNPTLPPQDLSNSRPPFPSGPTPPHHLAYAAPPAHGAPPTTSYPMPPPSGHYHADPRGHPSAPPLASSSSDYHHSSTFPPAPSYNPGYGYASASNPGGYPAPSYSMGPPPVSPVSSYPPSHHDGAYRSSSTVAGSQYSPEASRGYAFSPTTPSNSYENYSTPIWQPSHSHTHSQSQMSDHRSSTSVLPSPQYVTMGGLSGDYAPSDNGVGGSEQGRTTRKRKRTGD